MWKSQSVAVEIMEEIVVVDVVERSRKVHTWRDGMTMKRVKCETVRHGVFKKCCAWMCCVEWCSVYLSPPVAHVEIAISHAQNLEEKFKIQNSTSVRTTNLRSCDSVELTASSFPEVGDPYCHCHCGCFMFRWREC